MKSEFTYSVSQVQSDNDQTVVVAVPGRGEREDCARGSENCHLNASSDGSCIATSVQAWLASKGIQYDTSLLN